MRFSCIDAMIDPTFLAPLAMAAEEAGYEPGPDTETLETKIANLQRDAETTIAKVR